MVADDTCIQKICEHEIRHTICETILSCRVMPRHAVRIVLVDTQSEWPRSSMRCAMPAARNEWHAYISKKCSVQYLWRDNAPRHGFATYFFRVCKDAGAVVRAMGNSLQKFERHYWNKAESITEVVAAEWFAILPPEAEKIVPMDSAAAAS